MKSSSPLTARVALVIATAALALEIIGRLTPAAPTRLTVHDKDGYPALELDGLHRTVTGFDERGNPLFRIGPAGKGAFLDLYDQRGPGSPSVTLQVDPPALTIRDQQHVPTLTLRDRSVRLHAPDGGLAAGVSVDDDGTLRIWPSSAAPH